VGKNNLRAEEIKISYFPQTIMEISPGTWQQCVTQKTYYINHRSGKKESKSRGDKNKLFSTDNNGNIAWHLVAVCSKLDILQKIWELHEDNLTTEEVNNMWK
jgi:hypothetical protein